MDLDELRAVQTRERATDGLQELRDSFYADVATYIQDLRDQRDRAAADAEDPFRNPTVNDLTDEIETAEQVAEAIYERRIGKLVKQASLAAAGMPDDETGLTTEEQDLYTDLVERIRENKTGVLDVIAGDAPVVIPDADDEDSKGDGQERPPAPQTPPDAPPESETGSDSTSEPEPPATGDAPAETAPEPSTEDRDDSAAEVDRTTVRITQDVGEIFGVDEREYSLYADDVVTLPRENAKPLVERDAAEKLD